LQSVVTVRQCQAVQQCHTYLLTYLLTTRSGTGVTNYPITGDLAVRTFVPLLIQKFLSLSPEVPSARQNKTHKKCIQTFKN